MTEPIETPPPTSVELDPRRFLELSHDLFCVAGTDGYFRWLSPAWQATLGWSEEELLASPFLEFVHPDDREATLNEVRRLDQGQATVRFENRYRTPAGGWRWIQWNAEPLPDGTLYCVARDVTGRRDEVHRLTEQNRILELAGEVAGLGYWHLDPRNGTVWWSKAVYRIHGRSPDDRPTLQEGIDAYHPDDRQTVTDAVQAAVSSGEPFQFEARIVQPDGAVRNVLSRGVCEFDERGQVEAVFGIFLDLTDIKRMEETVRRAERMASVGTLAAGVAHEINNPLTYVKGNIELVSEEIQAFAGGSPAGRMREIFELLEEARQGAERVRRIVSGLKAFSRLDEARDEIVDVTAAVEIALNVATNELRHRARVVRHLDPIPFVRGDETRVVQVLVNLLVNAAQACPPGEVARHQVLVTTRTTPTGHAQVVIEDNGQGIRGDVKPRVFEPFFTTKDVGSGTGLGLPIVLGIVQNMGGGIDLESEEGKGTTVTVTLPAVEGMPDTERLPSSAAEGPVKGRLLIVDDNDSVRNTLQRALRGRHEIEVAEGGRQAVEILEAGAFDIILCDLMMPGFTGKDVYEWVRDHQPARLRSIIFVTGGALVPEHQEFLEAVPNHVLYKPVDVRSLRALIKEMMEHAGL